MSVSGLASWLHDWPLPFLFVLTIVVFFHELGHFLVGRWCGIKVDVFSLGFGPELVGFTDRKGTRWRIALVPLGGYVKFHGDMNPASAQAPSAVAGLPETERRQTFLAQPVGRRAAVVAAGPIANFLLAIVIFTGSFYIEGRATLLPRVNEVIPNSAAAKAGFAPGDFVKSIDGEKVESFTDMQRIVGASNGVPLHFEVERGGALISLEAVPEIRTSRGLFGTSSVGVLGVSSSADPADLRMEPLTLWQAAQAATGETWYVIERTGSYIGGLVIGRESTAQVSGPFGIARVAHEVAKIGFGALLKLAALLSISIGLINLVPIPLLDGGHLLFYAFEAVRGRPISERAQEFGFRIGLAIVSILMIFATYNDVSKFIPG